MKKWTKEAIIKEVLSYVKTIGLTVLVTYIVFSKIITQAQVPTGSMEDTIKTGSRVIINRTAYWFSEPQREDIIAFEAPDEEDKIYLKRVIGLPGETIYSQDGIIYINGEALEEDYIREISYYDFGPYTIPENCYFMMGDNRNSSYDSRYWNHKYVEKEVILGKVKIEIYPEWKVFD